jgi:hypothetical protein
MNDKMRMSLIQEFDEARPAFLAVLDQIVAELRPAILALPGFYEESIINCASVFADRQLVIDQLTKIHPGLINVISDAQIAEAHLTSICYLFSLVVHETVREHQELPR